MSGRDFEQPIAATAEPSLTETPAAIEGARIGELVGFADNGVRPLVVYTGQPGTAAIAARMVPDLRGAHIGRQVVLLFENGDPRCPIIMGCLQSEIPWPLEEKPAQVQIDSDGQRLIVTAKEELVLRCGQASITLTKAGKVLIQGAYVSSRSSGVNRIKGGSVQLN
ncbi:DUF6484 domain-containing protein [Paraburkholderia flagellata]|uniref:DUF6484 domain-containing protein n=1 Tax=Paraburkholderia flagellata TaxID=2883241 RepID=UPI001F3F4864|nr:DUF6484 domain-containing protein [Paraburkholderia flagellata]